MILKCLKGHINCLASTTTKTIFSIESNKQFYSYHRELSNLCNTFGLLALIGEQEGEHWLVGGWWR